jgi:hypothetical protein
MESNAGNPAREGRENLIAVGWSVDGTFEGFFVDLLGIAVSPLRAKTIGCRNLLAVKRRARIFSLPVIIRILEGRADPSCPHSTWRFLLSE